MRRLILADDEIIILRGLRKLMDWKALDIEIVGEATNGMEAEGLIRRLKPDVAILDIRMPLRSGLEVLERIRKDGFATRVVFLSSHQDFSYAKQAILHGASNYLVKPVRAQELSQAIRKAVSDMPSEGKANGSGAFGAEWFPDSETEESQNACYTGFALLARAASSANETMEKSGVPSVLEAVKALLAPDKRGVAFSGGNVVFIAERHEMGFDPVGEAERLLKGVTRQTGERAQIGIGPTRKGADKIRESLESAQNALNHRFLRPQESVFPCAAPHSATLGHFVPEIQHALEYMAANHGREITLDMVARVVHMNPCYFSVFFKKNAGMNFKDCLTKIRMEHAMGLLERGNYKTYELAEKVGFTDARYFSELFKKTYGFTPTGFLRNKR